MRIYKDDIFKEFIIETNNKKLYICKNTNRYGIITYEIYIQDIWSRKIAVLDDEVFLWLNIKPFNSWVHAYKFIKENINIIR